MSDSQNQQVYLAVDMGASSGRVVAGLFDGAKLQLKDVHRFENGAVTANDNLHWDLLRQWTHICDGLRAAGSEYGDAIKSVGVDTWGVDFGLLGRGDELLGNPYHYRDARTVGMMDAAFAQVSRDEIFAETGLQFMELNTLYQLLAMKESNSAILEAAEAFLMMPDLFHWLLTGQKANEFTDATTTQFYNPQTQGWSTALFDRFGLPTNILGEIAQPGTRLGTLRQSVCDTTGLPGIDVVLPGTHDTASAVMAVPSSSQPSMSPDWCYISSGTWSLMGAEIPSPIINDTVSRFNFTNEGGVGGTIRLLKNIAGLWLVQECRRIWKLAGHDYGWSTLGEMSSKSHPLVSLVNPDDAGFVAPKDMPAAIREYCRKTGQVVPEDEGSIIRCVLQSLALRYRSVLDMLEEMTGNRVETIHIVGGGTQNRQLCQMTADACNRRVVTGPIEATAIGNVMMQAVAAGAVSDIAEARSVIRDSFEMDEYAPRMSAPWDEAYARFEKLLDS
jgi:rhamnulokinase